MKTSQLFLMALLGLGISSAAHAQNTVPGAPGSIGVPSAFSTPSAPGTTGATIQGQPNVSGTVLPTNPATMGTTPSPIYNPSTVPTTATGSTIPTDATGILPTTQSLSTYPNTSATPTRSAPRRPASKTRTTNTPVRP